MKTNKQSYRFGNYIESIRKADLSASQKSILYCLATRMGDNGRCWPSLTLLQKESGYKSRSHLSAHLNNLIKLNVITKSREDGINSNVYSFTVDFLGGDVRSPGVGTSGPLKLERETRNNNILRKGKEPVDNFEGGVPIGHYQGCPSGTSASAHPAPEYKDEYKDEYKVLRKGEKPKKTGAVKLKEASVKLSDLSHDEKEMVRKLKEVDPKMNQTVAVNIASNITIAEINNVIELGREKGVIKIGAYLTSVLYKRTDKEKEQSKERSFLVNQSITRRRGVKNINAHVVRLKPCYN